MAEVDTDKRFNCSECRDEKMLSMDCEGDKEKSTRIPILPAVPMMYTKRCPMALIYDYPEALDFWEEYKTWKCFKVLPVFGGTEDQDPRLLQALQLFETKINKVEYNDKYIKWKSNKNKPKEESEPEEPRRKTMNSFADVQKKRKGK